MLISCNFKWGWGKGRFNVTSYRVGGRGRLDYACTWTSTLDKTAAKCAAIQIDICFQYMLITFEGIEYCRFLDKNEPEKGALEEMRFPTLERMLAVSGGV